MTAPGTASGSPRTASRKKLVAAKIDWVFMVCSPASWEHSGSSRPILTRRARRHVSAFADRRLTAGINWADVIVPGGIEVIDQRLVAHGFHGRRRGGAGGQGHRSVDQAADRAAVRLERVEPQQKGGYRYPVVAETKADAQGPTRFGWA